MLRRSSILTLAFLLAGCGHGFSPLAGSNLASSLDAQGRKILGGDAYAKFDVAPQLPKADGSRAATKLVYLMTDESHHQSMWSDKMMTAMSAWKPKAVHDLIFRDGMQVGELLFIDDSQANVDGARAAGLSAEYWHHDRGVGDLVALLDRHGLAAVSP